MSDEERFGFRVTNYKGDWSVWLPHQCEEWDIASSGWTGPDVTPAEAIGELERFIAEANEALTALREGRTFP